MFMDEARLASRIHHDNVVPTLDVVNDGKELFLVMEYVEGGSLALLARLAREQNRLIPSAVACAVISGALHGLHAAHEATDEQGSPLDIVHRDISPQNILISSKGVAKIIDFGVAKAATRLTSTATGQLKGKLSYMSPEQIFHGSSVDRRTDIYAMAVVLWETLTGQRLFRKDAESDASVAQRIKKGEGVVPPSQLAPGLPAGLDAVVLKGLSLDPGDRYPTASEFARVLEQAARNSPQGEIKDWVESLAGKEFEKQRHLISEIEKNFSQYSKKKESIQPNEGDESTFLYLTSPETSSTHEDSSTIRRDPDTTTIRRPLSPPPSLPKSTTIIAAAITAAIAAAIFFLVVEIGIGGKLSSSSPFPLSDAAPPPNTSPPPDAGPPPSDTGPLPDAAPSDAGLTYSDAGPMLDTRHPKPKPDAGLPPDAGPPPDAGSPFGAGSPSGTGNVENNVKKNARRVAEGLADAGIEPD